MAIKRKQGGEEESSERWLITYADLITLLLVLFLILYSIANIDAEKFKQLKGSLASAFDGIGIFAGQSNVTGDTGGEGILARFSSAVENVVSEGGGPDSEGGATLTETSVEQDFQYINNQIDELVTATGLQDKVSVQRTAEGIVINLAGELLFLMPARNCAPNPSSYSTASPRFSLPSPISSESKGIPTSFPRPIRFTPPTGTCPAPALSPCSNSSKSSAESRPTACTTPPGPISSPLPTTTPSKAASRIVALPSSSSFPVCSSPLPATLLTMKYSTPSPPPLPEPHSRMNNRPPHPASHFGAI